MAQELLTPAAGVSRLFKLDPRGKLLGLFLFPPCVFLQPLEILLFIPLLLFPLMGMTGLSPIRFFKESRGFLFFLGIFFFLGVLPKGENADLLFSGSPTQLIPSMAVIKETGQFIARLFLVYTLGVIFVRSTPVSQVRRALTWFLLPLPCRLGDKIGSAIGLTFTMFPLILDENQRIREAQKCRGSETVRNPVKRIINPLSPLLINVLVRSGTLADALDSRGWNAPFPQGNFRERFCQHPLHKTWTKRDTAVFIPLFLFFAGAVVFSRI